MAIELVMCRYCWAFAYYGDADVHIKKIREKAVTTFKLDSPTVEDHQKNIIEALGLYFTGWEKLRKLYNVMHLVSVSRDRYGYWRY